MTSVAKFEITLTRYLDEEGRPLGPLPDFAETTDNLIPLYRAMVLTRRFDAKAVALQRTGRMGTFASSLGQEAVSVGTAAAMTADDVLVPSYREAGAQLWRGTKMEELFLYWGGDERGSDYAGPREDFPVSIPVGSHGLHATGVAYAFKLRGQKRAAVCMHGDGATSKGDFYEAINFAGVWQVPAVFVVANNGWAISVPTERQTRAATIAQKGFAAGIEVMQVDGNDIIAMRDALGQALDRARNGGGPTLVEAITYRLTDHTTADDAGRYRPAEEVSENWKKDPIPRLRNYLVEAQAWDKAREEALLEEVNAEIEAAVAAYEATPPMPPTVMFDHLHAELPKAYQAQRAALAATTEGGSDD